MYPTLTPSNLDNIKIIDRSLNSSKIKQLFTKFGTMKKEGLNYDSGHPEKSARIGSSKIKMEILDTKSNEEFQNSILEGSFPFLKEGSLKSKFRFDRPRI